MPPPPDVLELLLPEADELELAHARKVTTFLRLLANDACPAHASTVQVDLGRARGELEGEGRRRLRAALVDLLRAHLAAAAGPESFLWCGQARLLPAAAWRVLDELRDERPWLAEVPAPGEPARDVAERLLASLTRLDESEGADAGGSAADGQRSDDASPERAAARFELELWRARLELARGEARAAERTARRALARARRHEDRAAKAATQAPEVTQVADVPGAPGAAPAAGTGNGARCWSQAFLATLVECLLERGAVGAARTELADVASPDERLRRLDAWSRLVSGDFAGARRALVGLPPWTGTLPAALADLREHRPGWLPCLAGRGPGGERTAGGAANAGPANAGARDARAEGPRCARTDLGASVLVAFAFRQAEGAFPVTVDAAPGLRDDVSGWLAEREGAHVVPSAPEHRLLVRARTAVEHRTGDAPLSGVLGRATTRAVVRVPCFAPRARSRAEAGAGSEREGEFVGWVHLELEHHLVPGAATLARLAQRWLPVVLAGRTDDSPGRERPADGTLPHGPSGEVFQELVAALGIKTAQRLWWGFELDGDTLRLVAAGGGGGGFSDRGALEPGTDVQPGALERARAAGGGVVFDEPEPSLSIHPDAASGVVVPLRLPVPERVRRGVIATGFLAVESSRKRDFGDAELARFVRIGETFALVHLCARYGAWSRERFGVDVRLDAGDESFQALAAHLFAAARSRVPAIVSGPSGAGKRVLARFLHFCGERPGGPLTAVACSAETRPLDRVFQRARGGTLVLEHVERLGAERQAELAGLLAGPDPVARRKGVAQASAGTAGDEPLPRVIATTRGSLAESVGEGRLRDDLARRLERVQVRVRGLAERRFELPGLAAFLARRIADEEGLPRPELADETLALLWRQPWPGNVRELEALLHKLVLLHPGETVVPEHVVALAEHHGLELDRRLSSRRPERATILAALQTTRTAGGRANKTRAALYLGWDPDTLVSRMEEAGIEGPAADP